MGHLRGHMDNVPDNGSNLVDASQNHFLDVLDIVIIDF
jgi:hypothetical protein